MKDVPASLVVFARLGLVAAVGVALWTPVDQLTATGTASVERPATSSAAPASEPLASPAIIEAGTELLAQGDTDNSLLLDFVDAVGLAESNDTEAGDFTATLLR